MTDEFGSSSAVNRTPPGFPTIDQPNNDSIPEESLMDRPNTPASNEHSRLRLEPVPNRQEQGMRTSTGAGRSLFPISSTMNEFEMNDLKLAALEVLEQIQREDVRRNKLQTAPREREAENLNQIRNDQRTGQGAYGMDDAIYFNHPK